MSGVGGLPSLQLPPDNCVQVLCKPFKNLGDGKRQVHSHIAIGFELMG